MMAEKPSNLSLINAILEDEEEKTLEEEEIIHLLLERKVSRNTEESAGALTLGERMADNIARFAGSWTFILTFIGCLLLWIAVNILLAVRAFDPFPFILLNLVLSCIAAVQAPLIMMSQNRQEAKDRARAENDYRVNLKSELIVDDLHLKLDEILRRQETLEAELKTLRDKES